VSSRSRIAGYGASANFASVILRIVGAVAMLVFALVAYTPAANLLNRVFSPPARLDSAAAIVVLAGGGLHADGTLSDVSMRRALYGIALYRRGLAPLLVFSGPPGDRGPSEGAVRGALAREMGVPGSAIIVEPSARTTREEAERISALLLARGLRRALLVVDAQGAYRAGRLFERKGVEPLLAPAEDVSSLDASPEGRLGLARRLAIEIVAVAYYRVAGYL
jgi:uncharacterized SAM-binding protein YcdF (DUF218 family)